MITESPKTLSPVPVKQYHVFLASPGDVAEERQAVRQFFERYNRHIAQLWGVRFEVVDWENYATVGVGCPQELITKQTLDRFKDSLALVVGMMAQRFGSPTGNAESGTEEEFRWALQSNRETGYPEIKWFFKCVDKFVSPPDPDAITESLNQWKKVRAFRNELKSLGVFFAEYPESTAFRDTFENDLSRWLTDRARPWIPAGKPESHLLAGIAPPRAYYETIERDFRRLDIAGIDNDRAFDIPLSEIYVRLRVMFDEDSPQGPDKVREAGPIDIQTALLRYPKLAIVGDPGSGKSTFLKYVALMLARSVLANSPTIALEKLCLQEPLPIPVFVSCWDLSDFLKKKETVEISSLLAFLTGRLSACGFPVADNDLETILTSGGCCLMFDGLDEVPADSGRAAVSRLLEDLVKRFPQNRYLVTSRIRAYTGDTILKGEFTRCDVQPFDANDRAQFLKNWIGLLFKVTPDQVFIEGSESNREFQSLTAGIEKNDRIRPLAINPLLLTVIAIVHWNRKRLPEQRVELYDECVDVLLGQRKEAEHVQLGRKTGTFDEQHEQQQREERSWVRKRFAEIALHIQSGDGNRDEANKADVVRMLAPRFIDQGASNQEQAESRATLFLNRQELRSGLLVSRREQSYRFVHLTFQEYLAAWHLSNQEFDNVASLIQPRIRQQKWFETLQLIGAEWAKKSDEKLDRYVAWLLDHQGQSIAERAPVIALCANIVKDTSRIAELTLETRKKFQQGVEGTLDAFRAGSGIPALTQLEILEALGHLGAAVKPHLIDATKSSLFQVRRRAIEMLLPHLSDDDLFGMVHIMGDRSKEPIKTFLLSLLSRKVSRAVDWLLHRKSFGEKATEAFVEVMAEFEQMLDAVTFTKVVQHVFATGKSYNWWWHDSPLWPFWPARARMVSYLGDPKLISTAASKDLEPAVRAKAFKELIRTQGTQAETWKLVRKAATADEDFRIREQALVWLTTGQKDKPETWQLVREVVMKDKHVEVRGKALELLAAGQKDAPGTWQLVREAVTKDKDVAFRVKALELLTAGQKDAPETWHLLREASIKDQEVSFRVKALELLTAGQKDAPETWQLLREAAVKDKEVPVRVKALELLTESEEDAPEMWQLFREVAAKDKDTSVRVKALELLTAGQKDAPETWQLVREAVIKEKDPDFSVRVFFLVVKVIFTNSTEKQLLTRDLDSQRPALDANKAITQQRVKDVSLRLMLSEDKVRELYERIAETLSSRVGIHLSLEWKAVRRGN
jgi:NACHT domain